MTTQYRLLHKMDYLGLCLCRDNFRKLKNQYSVGCDSLQNYRRVTSLLTEMLGDTVASSFTTRLP